MKLTPSSGKWFPYPGDDEVGLKLKRIPVDAFTGDMNFFDKVIVDWKGFKDVDGKNVPCTRATKLYVLFETDEGPELTLWIARKTQSWDEFIDIAEIKKKLEQRSNGASTTPEQKKNSVETA